MRLINISVAILFLTASGPLHAASLEFTSDEVGIALQQYFPIHIDTKSYKITLNKPLVIFRNRETNLAVQMDTTALLSDGYTVKGKSIVHGRLDYSAAKGELYLRKPALVFFESDKLPKKYDQTVKDGVSTVTKQFIPPLMVYRLNKDNILENVILQTLKSFTIKDGKILTELAWLPGENPASGSK